MWPGEEQKYQQHTVLKYEPKWDKKVDLCPDRNPSQSALYIERAPFGSRYFLQVKGLGVVTVHVTPGLRGSKYPALEASSALSKEAIGPSPRL